MIKLKELNTALIQAAMTYSAYKIRSLFYLLKEILNLVTSFLFFLVPLFSYSLCLSGFSRYLLLLYSNCNIGFSWYFLFWYSICSSGFPWYHAFDNPFYFLGLFFFLAFWCFFFSWVFLVPCFFIFYFILRIFMVSTFFM